MVKTTTKDLSRKVDEINVQLRAFGRAAVQEIKMMRDGYKPQYVFDAVNSILLPENWRYEVVSKEIFDNQIVAELKLIVRVTNEWLLQGIAALYPDGCTGRTAS